MVAPVDISLPECFENVSSLIGYCTDFPIFEKSFKKPRNIALLIRPGTIPPAPAAPPPQVFGRDPKIRPTRHEL